MRVDEKGLKILANFEGTVLSIYLDQAGVKTIGTGHALRPDEIASHVYDHGITKEQALALLRRDVADAEAAINRMVKVPLTQEQFDALASFTFNLGAGALQGSTLLQKLNAGDYGAVPGELERWNKRKDPRTGQLVVDAGLLARRRAEGAMWLSGHDHPETVQAVSDATLDEEAARAAALRFDLVASWREQEGHPVSDTDTEEV